MSELEAIPPAPAPPVERHPFPPLDPNRNNIIAVFGRKGSGKSVFAREVFRAWPAVDKLVIDPTGDADPGADLGTVTVTELPSHMPAGKPDPRTGQRRPPVLRWVATPTSPTYAEDLDRAVGLVLFPKDKPALLWVDEAGEVFPANRTGPHARLLLHQSRHWKASAIVAGPRPMNLDPLVIAQADRVVMYDVPHPRDRERIAGAIGWEPKTLARELDATRAAGPFWFLMYDAIEHTLYRCPPLPIGRRRAPAAAAGVASEAV